MRHCHMWLADIAVVCAWLLMLYVQAYRVADGDGIGAMSPATLCFRVHDSLHREVPGVDHYGATLYFRVHGSRVVDDDGSRQWRCMWLTISDWRCMADDIGLRHAGIW